MVDPPTLWLVSTRLDEIRLTEASAGQPTPRRTKNSPSPAERTGACEAMIDEDAVADAECMKAVAPGGVFRISPEGDGSKQLYLPDTAVLISRFLMPDGVGEVQDFMPPPRTGEPAQRQRMVRRVLAVRGR